MQRTRVQAREESLGREKETKYIGSARIRLEHFDFSKSEPDMPDRSNVKILVSIFEGGGCFQQDSQHHVTAVIGSKCDEVGQPFLCIVSILDYQAAGDVSLP